MADTVNFVGVVLPTAILLRIIIFNENIALFQMSVSDAFEFIKKLLSFTVSQRGGLFDDVFGLLIFLRAFLNNV